jgi:hypothetical protein
MVSQAGGELDDAVIWLPDAPNSPTGHMQTLGALGWNEDGDAFEINAAGITLGYSRFFERHVSDAVCQQARSFVWNQHAEMQELHTLLDPANEYTDVSVWTLNEQGQIVAVGETSAEMYHALLLTPH